MILLDDSGRIMEAVYAPRAYNNALDDVYYLLKNGGSIYSTFNIPDKQRLNELAFHLSDSNAAKAEYQNKQGVLSFEGAQEEFYTILPLAMIRLVALNDNKILGIIRLSNFFIKISPILHRQPILVIDGSGSIVGYNRSFLVCSNTADNSKTSLLNKDIKDLISPTPDEIQITESEAFVMPVAEKWQKRLSIDCKDKSLFNSFVRNGAVESDGDALRWRAEEENYSYFRFPEPVDEDMVDIMVRFEISSPSPLPSLMLGENVSTRAEYTPDANGYMAGPLKDFSALQLKKQGETVFAGDNVNLKDFKGICEYIKVGRTFVVNLNGRRAFVYHDFEGLYNKEFCIYLSIRKGDYANIRNLELYIGKRDNPVTVINRFVTIRNEDKRQYLIERMPATIGVALTKRYSVFLLRDASDIRKAMQDLEENYRIALERESKELAFIAESAPMLQIRSLASKAALTNTTVLIQGETGSGKEVLARYVHSVSSYKSGSFMHVDCSTIPSTLMESILFGHSKGAFTGAAADNVGLFQQADNGTLFIDEIHNVSLEVQAKLLRFLEDRTITPVGAKKSIRLNVRIIIATNADLMQMVKDGKFRQDLYYRIAVIVLRLPPLRERMEDIPSLIALLIREFNLKHKRNIAGLCSSAYRSIYDYGWPGNVRELRNVIERAVVFSTGNEICDEDLKFEGADRLAQSQTMHLMKKSRKSGKRIKHKPEEISALIAKNNGYMTRVAEELNVTRQTLYQFIRKYGICPDNYR